MNKERSMPVNRAVYIPLYAHAFLPPTPAPAGSLPPRPPDRPPSLPAPIGALSARPLPAAPALPAGGGSPQPRPDLQSAADLPVLSVATPQTPDRLPGGRPSGSGPLLPPEPGPGQGRLQRLLPGAPAPAQRASRTHFGRHRRHRRSACRCAGPIGWTPRQGGGLLHHPTARHPEKPNPLSPTLHPKAWLRLPGPQVPVALLLEQRFGAPRGHGQPPQP